MVYIKMYIFIKYAKIFKKALLSWKVSKNKNRNHADVQMFSAFLYSSIDQDKKGVRGLIKHA